MTGPRPLDPQALRVLAALRAAAPDEAVPDALLRAAYPSGAIPATGFQNVRQRISELRAAGHAVAYAGRGRGYRLERDAGDAPERPRRNALAGTQTERALAALREAKGATVPPEVMARAVFGEGEPPPDAARTLANLAGAMRNRGYGIRGSATFGFWLPPHECSPPPKAVPSSRRCLGGCGKHFKPEHGGQFVCGSCAGRESYGFETCAVLAP